MANPHDPIVPASAAETNPFRQPNANALQAPSAKAVKITADVSFACCRALWCGAAGAATITCASGDVATLFPLQAGLNPIGATLVASAGLVASDIWALY